MLFLPYPSQISGQVDNDKKKCFQIDSIERTFISTRVIIDKMVYLFINCSNFEAVTEFEVYIYPLLLLKFKEGTEYLTRHLAQLR